MEPYTKTIEEVLNTLNTSRSGLGEAEVRERIAQYGYNQLDYRPRTSNLVKFLLQFHNILIYILLASAVMTVLLQHWLDTAVILGVVILNAIVGYIQEGKAERSLEAIRDMLNVTAEVVRDGGQHFIIPARELVVGDIVELKNGDKVPADIRLIADRSLQIQEAILTGESEPVTKRADQQLPKVSLGDRVNMAYSGSSVVYGRGTGVVVATGKNTELGKMGTTLENVEKISTPLVQQIDRLSFWLMVIILSLALVNFVVGIGVWKLPVDSTFLAAVGLAVAAVPEGLPPILTVILAIGVKKMADHNAIVRHLPVIESMGAVNTICTDKTGTLTRNEQVVQRVLLADQLYQVRDDGLFYYLQDNKWIGITFEESGVLSMLLDCGTLCNEGHYNGHDHKGAVVCSGNPIDKALLKFAVRQGVLPEECMARVPRIDIIPYESELKFMATLHHDHDGHQLIYLKGAPEKLLLRCQYELTDRGVRAINKNYWESNILDMAKKGHRMLALAYKDINETEERHQLRFSDIDHGMVLVGILGLIDAPRTEVLSAVQQCYDANIEVKMITGDHAVTAGTIAGQVGISTTYGVLTGDELDKMSDQELAAVVGKVNVYARTSPDHKLRLVQALQQQGKVVAMTGDGANDAPALRKADVGVAMGSKGAEIAKESSDIVLADDNFATIVSAVAAGRVVYDNIKKVILHVLPTNMAEAFVILMAILCGATLPITPLQILWVNMITSVCVSSALGFEAPEAMVMLRPPRKSNEAMFSLVYIGYMLMVTLVLTVAVFAVFYVLLQVDDIALARTTAVNVLIFGELAFLFNCRKLHGRLFSCLKIHENPVMYIAVASTLGVQLLFSYNGFMHDMFGTSSMGILEWTMVLVVMVAVFITSEIYKLLLK